MSDNQKYIDLAPAERRNDLALAFDLGWKIEQHHSGGWVIIEPNGYRHGYYAPFSGLLEEYLPQFHANLSDAVRLWPGPWEITRCSDMSIAIRLKYIDMVVSSASGDATVSIATVFCHAVRGAIATDFPLFKYVVSQKKIG